MTEAAIARPAAAARRIDYFSEEASARVRRRYAAERRFRLMGLLAIAVAGLFVVVLLGDIIRKGLPAFHEHKAALEITLDASHIDPKGTRLPADLRAGDYQAVVRDALRRIFPDVSDRRARRQLEGIISSGAADDIRAMVMANPALIGQTIRFPLLLSDDADLYMKGVGTRVIRSDGRGTLAIRTEGRNVDLQAPENGFAPALAAVKRRLVDRLAALELELARLNQATGESEQLTARRNELTQRIAELRRRAGDQSVAETLDGTLPSVLVEVGGGLVKLAELAPGAAKGTLLITPQQPADSATAWKIAIYETPETNRRVSDAEAAWLESLRGRGAIESGFAWRFFTNGDSREPELAGIRGALIGSALTLLVTLVLCLPIGVAAAIYLEEFAPKNRFTDLLEVNINNLAAVPSIVFGLLGLAVFLNFFDLPRSAPLVGGLVLALLVLPTIIIASRAALKAVPPSIKEAALGVGASHQQAIFHHVLPLAMPGIMTGTIIGMAHALGETAPLLMIGMVAFIVEIPKAITDAATVLPVQIFLWSDLPELAFQSKTAATIMVLLGFLFVMNGAAILLRRRFERRW